MCSRCIVPECVHEKRTAVNSWQGMEASRPPPTPEDISRYGASWPKPGRAGRNRRNHVVTRDTFGTSNEAAAVTARLAAWNCFGKARVAAIEITDGELHVGDTIHIVGHTSDLTQKIESMQIDRAPVESAKAGDAIGVQVIEHAREHDEAFRVLPD